MLILMKCFDQYTLLYNIIQGLAEGNELEFRVRAVNDAGKGTPSETTGSHIIRDPICLYTYIYTQLLICP